MLVTCNWLIEYVLIILTMLLKLNAFTKASELIVLTV